MYRSDRVDPIAGIRADEENPNGPHYGLLDNTRCDETDGPHPDLIIIAGMEPVIRAWLCEDAIVLKCEGREPEKLHDAGWLIEKANRDGVEKVREDRGDTGVLIVDRQLMLNDFATRWFAAHPEAAALRAKNQAKAEAAIAREAERTAATAAGFKGVREYRASLKAAHGVLSK